MPSEEKDPKLSKGSAQGRADRVKKKENRTTDEKTGEQVRDYRPDVPFEIPDY